MKTYTFKLVIREGSDHFWDSLEGKTGCDEVTETIKDVLAENGFFTNEDDVNELILTKFEDE